MLYDVSYRRLLAKACNWWISELSDLMTRLRGLPLPVPTLKEKEREKKNRQFYPGNLCWFIVAELRALKNERKQKKNKENDHCGSSALKLVSTWDFYRITGSFSSFFPFEHETFGVMTELICVVISTCAIDLFALPLKWFPSTIREVTKNWMGWSAHHLRRLVSHSSVEITQSLVTFFYYKLPLIAFLIILCVLNWSVDEPLTLFFFFI